MSRPIQYTAAQRKEIKIQSNKYYHQLKKKERLKESAKSKQQIKDEFISGMTALKDCEFNYFITLTLDPNRVKKKHLLKQLEDDQVKRLISEFPEMINYLQESKPQRQSIEFVNNIGTAFFNFLFGKKLITNVLSALEKDKQGKWHIHALITSSSDLLIESAISTYWFYGITKTIDVGYGLINAPIDLEAHRKKIIEYMFDSYNPSSTSNVQQKRMDYWYLHDYKRPPFEQVAKMPEFSSNQSVDRLFKNVSLGTKSVKTDERRNEIISSQEWVCKNYQLSPTMLFFLLTALLLLF